MKKYDKLLERFLRYVRIDTQSVENKPEYPSTETQLSFLSMLKEEMADLGLVDISGDDEVKKFGFLQGRIPANTETSSPPVAFIAHVDTSPEEKGAGVKPIIHENYDGSPIKFPLDPEMELNAKNAPMLAEKKGRTIITASGDTLLGADDKAGLAEILTAVEYLNLNRKIKHGDIWIVFTCDEEVGKGTKYITRAKINADYAYTVDGGGEGIIETETFNASVAEIFFKGFNTHPGTAKNQMINAIRGAGIFLAKLPIDQSPERTEAREGFLHPLEMKGEVNQAWVRMIIRDFTKSGLKEKENLLSRIKEETCAQYEGISIDIKLAGQYENMKDTLLKHPLAIEAPFKAAEKIGIHPKEGYIRGGTDGARLTEMGLPTPNLWTGGYLFHSKYEFAVYEEMESAVSLIIEIVKYFAGQEKL